MEPDEQAEALDTGVAGAALGAILMELEIEFPGIIERAADRLENHQIRSAVISLRGPRIAPKITRDLDSGVAWLRVCAMIANAALGPIGKGKKRRR